jgi:hypothetical protein
MDKGREYRAKSDARRTKHRDDAMASHGEPQVLEGPTSRWVYQQRQVVSREQVRLGHVIELSCGHRLRTMTAYVVGATVDCASCPTIRVHARE